MAETTTGAAAPKGFRGAEQGWPELHRIPHPPRRLPLLGDVLGASRTRPLQHSLRHARRLGPIFRRKAFANEIVFVWGADLTADLSDESRFAKHVGLGIANLRPIVGDALFTAYFSPAPLRGVAAPQSTSVSGPPGWSGVPPVPAGGRPGGARAFWGRCSPRSPPGAVRRPGRPS